MGHVFISYASENGDEAGELVSLIEAKGMTAWIAPRDVRPGFDYSEELQRALETCIAFVVIVTPEANTSPYVRAETEMAFSNQKPMLPVRIADVAPAPGLAFFLKIRHWTDAYGAKREAALKRLVLELQTLTGTAPDWAPSNAPAAAAPPPLATPPAPAPAPPPSPPPPPQQSASPPPLTAGSAAPPKRSFPPVLILALIGGFVVAAAVAIWLITRSPRTSPPPPDPGVNNTMPEPEPPPAQPGGFANELTDYGVQPKNELETNVGSPTPLGIPFGGRLTTQDLQRLIAGGRVVLVDVLVDPHPQTLLGAYYMPAGGQPGAFDDANQNRFSQQLQIATQGDATRPLVFFCAGSSCWESYNAVLRANALGYTQLYWYRGGIAAWQEAGQPMGGTPQELGVTPQAPAQDMAPATD